MMTASRLRALSETARQEPAFTRVALDDLSNPDKVRQQLRTELEKHFRAKESSEELVERIRKVTGYTADRAKTIAQTEKTRAANGTRYSEVVDEYLAAYEKARRNHRKRPERPEGMWIDPRTAKEPRSTHVAISGTVKPIGEEFRAGLHYPGDPQAPASEIINCHCYWRRVRRR